VSTVSEASGGPVTGRSAGRVIAAVILAVVAILCIIAAILYFSESAKSLPSILGTIKFNGHNASRADNHRSTRGIAALIVGVVCLAAAWFAYAWKTKDRDA
jgi:amino acid permease